MNAHIRITYELYPRMDKSSDNTRDDNKLPPRCPATVVTVSTSNNDDDLTRNDNGVFPHAGKAPTQNRQKKDAVPPVHA